MTNGPTDNRSDTHWLKWLSIAFGLWAAVLPLSAWIVVTEVDKLSEEVDRGILPVTEERIKSMQREIERLEQRVQRLEGDHRDYDRVRQ